MPRNVVLVGLVLVRSRSYQGYRPIRRQTALSDGLAHLNCGQHALTFFVDFRNDGLRLSDQVEELILRALGEGFIAHAFDACLPA